MKWGDTQNLLSVIIGLNLAYYAFKEMREPHLNRLLNDIQTLKVDNEKTQDDLDKVSEWANITDKPSPMRHQELKLQAINHWNEVCNLWVEVFPLIEVTKTQKFESRLGTPAMIVGTLSIALLIISTIKYNDGLPMWLFFVIVFVGFLPVVAIVSSNYLILWGVTRRFGKRYGDLWYRLNIEIRKDWDFLHVAQARSGVQHRYDKKPGD